MPPKASFWDYLPLSHSQFQRAKGFAFAIAIAIFTWLSVMALASIKYAIIDLPSIQRVVRDGTVAEAEYTCKIWPYWNEAPKNGFILTAIWKDGQSAQRTATLKYNSRREPYITLCHIYNGDLFYLANEPSVPPVPKLVANAEIQGGVEEILGKLEPLAKFWKLWVDRTVLRAGRAAQRRVVVDRIGMARSFALDSNCCKLCCTALTALRP